jgi:hypothetical protein
MSLSRGLKQYPKLSFGAMLLDFDKIILNVNVYISQTEFIKHTHTQAYH